MSVAAGGGASKIDKTKLNMYGLGGGILGIYLAHVLNMTTGTGYFSFLAGLGAIAAVVMGADAVRRVCAYGIGTGVPSIGMMAMGMGLVAAMFGLAVAGVAGPIIGIAIAMGFGYFVGSPRKQDHQDEHPGDGRGLDEPRRRWSVSLNRPQRCDIRADRLPGYA